MTREQNLIGKVRQRIGSAVIDGAFRSAARLGKLHPKSKPERHGVSVQKNVSYGPRREHRLDIYRPETGRGPWPTVLYVHGGGFRILSKDTHWVMGLAFARAGYLVFNIDYRLAPRHRFPAALEDCATAFSWLMDHGDAFGADLNRLVFAGESAGANLITSLTQMCCYERSEPYAKQVWDRERVPRAILPYCGVFQVSDIGRFKRRKPNMANWLNDRLLEVSTAYLGKEPEQFGSELELADPLNFFERGLSPDRPLPPCFLTVGTKDPLLDDTRRLHAALQGLETPCEAAYYPGEVHAFQALVWREQARKCWGDSFRFLRKHL